MAQATPARTKAFISYSHEDEEYLRELRHHLKFLEQRGLMDVFWADTEIKPGDLWRAQIKEAIASARVAIFLVSPAFFASEFIAQSELPPVLEAARVHETLVLSVILDHSLFQYSDLAEFQSINSPSKPLAALTKVERNAIWVQVVERVLEALKRPLSQPPKRMSDPLPERTSDPPIPSTLPQKTKEGWLAEGNTHRNAKRYAEALAAYEQAVLLDPNYFNAWHGKGNALNDLKRHDEALAAYDEALRLNPQYAFAWNGKGNALFELRWFEKALAAYEVALLLNPAFAMAWSNKGLSLERLGRAAEAKQARDRARELGYSG